MAHLAITLRKSYYKRDPRHRKTLDALGLRKLNRTVYKQDSPAIRGMIKQLEYALSVEEMPADFDPTVKTQKQPTFEVVGQYEPGQARPKAAVAEALETVEETPQAAEESPAEEEGAANVIVEDAADDEAEGGEPVVEVEAPAEASAEEDTPDEGQEPKA